VFEAIEFNANIIWLFKFDQARCRWVSSRRLAHWREYVLWNMYYY